MSSEFNLEDFPAEAENLARADIEIIQSYGVHLQYTPRGWWAEHPIGGVIGPFDTKYQAASAACNEWVYKTTRR